MSQLIPAENWSPVLIAFHALTEAHKHCTADELRKLILELDLVVASFGCGINDREAVACPDDLLAHELIFTAAPLAKLPDSFHDQLTAEIEELLATSAPAACVGYFGRRKLWKTAPERWCQLTGLLLRHVKTPEDRFTITAIVSEKFFESAT
jgi:hypothetical protein